MQFYIYIMHNICFLLIHGLWAWISNKFWRKSIGVNTYDCAWNQKKWPKKTNIELPFILLILKLIKTTASRDCRPLADYNLRICRKYTPKSAISLFIFTCICRIMLQMLCTHAVTEFLSDYNYTSVSSVSVSRCNRWGEDVTPAAPGTFQQLNKIKQIYFHLYNFIY